MEFSHEPVMLKECIEGLKIKANGIYVDGTLGGAGHSSKILEQLSIKGKLIGIDRDKEALKAAAKRLENYQNVIYIHGNHDHIQTILQEQGICEVDGILLDLGVSSYQLDERSRGFSYIGEATLDMRMDTSKGITAKEVVNTYSEEKLAEILWQYGEEKYSKQIAKNICKMREKEPIETTSQLVQIIQNSIPKAKQKDGHPAKRTFQAIRIEVNNEIEPLYQTIVKSIHCLKQNGRLVVITFHSLEDRAVKNAMADLAGKCTCPNDLPYCVCNYESWGKVINKKPIEASQEEKQKNPRSKSAKVRIFERCNKDIQEKNRF
ncbi:MAG: 16S rRNA (cytosine(1402)-N(4))-methyltransferase RsmH [Clostridia bacterium]|nr:16S rRNA (cytosine(1402)-N(4))-methyltransferase RsmH [Clostridia bacterium]